MKFSTEPSKVKSVSLLDLMTMQEDFTCFVANLDKSVRQMSEVDHIVNNVNFSLNAISKYGVNAIKVLNIDGSLENLLAVSENMITVDKAVEGLSDASRTAWEKVKEFVRRIVDAVKAFYIKHNVKAQLELLRKKFESEMNGITDEALKKTTVSALYFPRANKLSELSGDVASLIKMCEYIPKGDTYEARCSDLLRYFKSCSSGFTWIYIGQDDVAFNSTDTFEHLGVNVFFDGFYNPGNNGMDEISLYDAGYRRVEDIKNVVSLSVTFNDAISKITNNITRCMSVGESRVKVDELEILTYSANARLNGCMIRELSKASSHMTRYINIAYRELLNEQNFAAHNVVR